MKMSNNTFKKMKTIIYKMETDIGNPIDYNPNDFEEDMKNHDNRESINEQENTDKYHFPQHQNQNQMNAPYHPYMDQFVQHPHEKQDLLSSLDKTAYAIIFIAFILGFFMGKTMQPVILRPG
jgi:Ca2+-dependent lipid-binding protein|tara:strand:- start:750 stop:1115 length:366 start_codon:yes stop_codon:yes gene_type:complete